MKLEEQTYDQKQSTTLPALPQIATMPIQTPSENSRIATLQTIDFSRLMDRDVTEQNKLLELSVKDGFFYLDLQGPRIGKILEDKAAVVRMMEWYFALPEGEKMKDDRGTHTHGWAFIFGAFWTILTNPFLILEQI